MDVQQASLDASDSRRQYGIGNDHQVPNSVTGVGSAARRGSSKQCGGSDPGRPRQATGGGGATENRIFDNSFKYSVNVGPFRAAAEAQLRAGFGGALGNAFQGQIGADYMGLSVDAIFSHVEDAITSAPLPVGTLLSPTLINPEMDLLRELSLTTCFMLLAKYTIGPVKILGGYEHMQFVNPKPLACGRVRRGGY
jgi:hypothetical protein